jgi:hypothetical protein
MHPTIDDIFDRQVGLITRRQALAAMTQGEIAARLGRYWQVVLPGVYAGFTGALTSRQRDRAALLFAGDGAMLSDLTALRRHRIGYLPDDSAVRVLVADTVQRSSREFVIIRRTTRLPRPAMIDGLPAAPVYRALCEFVARHQDERVSLAVAASAVQLGRASLRQLVDETWRGPARGRPRLLRMIESLDTGVRSRPEDDFRRLVARSRVLPTALFNPQLILPNGRRISPDALFVDSAVVHETNGRDVHAGFNEFEDMQRRHDELTAAGLTVLHNAPRRIRRDGAAVLSEVEDCHRRFAGRGLPVGVTLVSAEQCDVARP